MTAFTLEDLSNFARDGNMTEIRNLLKNNRHYEYHFSCVLIKMCRENNENVIKQLIDIYDGKDNCFEKTFFYVFGLKNKELAKMIIENYGSKLDLNEIFDSVCLSYDENADYKKMIEWLFNSYPIDTTKLYSYSRRYIEDNCLVQSVIIQSD